MHTYMHICNCFSLVSNQVSLTQTSNKQELPSTSETNTELRDAVLYFTNFEKPSEPTREEVIQSWSVSMSMSLVHSFDIFILKSGLVLACRFGRMGGQQAAGWQRQAGGGRWDVSWRRRLGSGRRPEAGGRRPAGGEGQVLPGLNANYSDIVFLHVFSFALPNFF